MNTLCRQPATMPKPDAKPLSLERVVMVQYVIQKHFIGHWDDVELVSGEQEGKMLLRTCDHASRMHRLIKRTEQVIAP